MFWNGLKVQTHSKGRAGLGNVKVFFNSSAIGYIRMKRTILLYFITLFMLFGSPVYALELHVTGGNLSIQADNEPLMDILRALADQGIAVYADPGINPYITASFKNREIEHGLKIIFRDLNHILVWKSVDTPAGRFTRLVEVHLFIPGKKAFTKIISRGTQRLAKNPHDGSIFIRNEILIRLSKELDLKQFKEFLIENGLAVSGYNRIAGTIKIILTDGSDYFTVLELISSYPGIEKAEPNYAYPVHHPVFIPGTTWEPARYQAGTVSGNQVPVAVIDSGLSPDYLSAPYIYASFNCLDPDKTISDSLGHGTQMAMIAGGAVKPLGTGDESGSINPVIAVKGFDEDGYISSFDLLNGIEFAINNGARVVSLSWGSETDSEFLEQAFDYAASRGTIILGAAGNEATGTDMYPAAYKSVIGVGALDPRGEKWDKSNYGDFVNIYAPGFASFPVGYNDEPGIYAGTSISTAYVANLMAGYLSKNPDATLKEILTALSDTSEDKK
jgi:thermitase